MGGATDLCCRIWCDRKGRFLFQIASCLCQTDSLIMLPVGLSIWPNSQISAGQDKGLFAQQGSSVSGGGAGGRKSNRRFPPQEILWFTIKETVFSSHLSLKFMPSIYFLAQIPYILEIWDESVLSSKGKKQKPQALCGLK